MSSCWNAMLEIHIPPDQKIPDEIAHSLIKTQKIALNLSSILHDLYVTLLEESICRNPRKLIPQLGLFKQVIVRPWTQIVENGEVIYISQARVSGWLETNHPPYIPEIRLTFHQF